MTRAVGLEALADAYDLAIVGAGPAGMAAAVTARELGLSVVVLDRGMEAGGQIYRGIRNSPLAGRRSVLGAEYWKGEALVGAFLGCGADLSQQSTVWYLDDALRLGVSRGGQARLIAARQVILATGALERPMPIPGWDLPGVMTAGAGQILLKTSGVVPGGRVVLVGDGPLLWLLAAQYLRCGVRPSALVLTTPRGQWRKALAALPGFLASPYLLKGSQLLWHGRRELRLIDGSGGVEIARSDGALVVRTPGGDLPADHVLLHQGVVPEVNLARAAGCRLAWHEDGHCWVPEVDPWGNTSVAGLAVAGDGAGIAGAEAAAIAGRLAARNAAVSLGRLSLAARDAGSAGDWRAMRRFRRGRAFLDQLFAPGAAMRAGSASGLACRCEEIDGATLRQVVATTGATGPNQLKAYTRCGMGPCQGRLCGLTVGEVLAEAGHCSPKDFGYYRLRPPVFPISVAEMATMPALPDEASRANRP